MITPRSGYKPNGFKPVSSRKTYEDDTVRNTKSKKKIVKLREFKFNSPNKQIIDFQIKQMFKGWDQNDNEKDDKNVQ